MREITILVVDDEADIRATVSAMLEIEGYDVAEASNGADALHVLEERRPDLILLDMRMPILDGWGFAAELRRRGHRTPIVVMTAARDAAHWAAEIAAAAFVAKPFGFEDLIAAVEQVGCNKFGLEGFLRRGVAGATGEQQHPNYRIDPLCDFHLAAGLSGARPQARFDDRG